MTSIILFFGQDKMIIFENDIFYNNNLYKDYRTHFITKNIEKDIVSALVPFTILQDKRILLRVLKFSFFSSFFGTIASEHTCLKLHCDWSMILTFGHLRERETYIFTRTPLCGISARSWRIIPLIDLSTNKVNSRVKLSWVSILSFPLGHLYCNDNVDFIAFHCTVSDTIESYNV